MDLTPRQLEVTELVARGYSNARIAGELGVSPETVKVHIRDAADRVPGTGGPRYKLIFFWLTKDTEP